MRPLTNTLEIQELAGKLLKRGLRVFIEPVTGMNYSIKGYVIAYQTVLTNGHWGKTIRFEKQVSKDWVTDAYVKTVMYLYNKQFKTD